MQHKALLTFISGLALIGGSSTGCVYSKESSVSLQDDASSDKKYDHVHERATMNAEIIKDFETRYQVSTTYLSPEFRNAFAQRYERVYREPEPVLQEASAKAGFFVTLFSPDSTGYDLTDTHTWTIHLKSGDKLLKPVLVKKLHEKERWQPFFRNVHKWSKEYLVLFETPSVQTNSPDMVAKESLTLEISNADAHVDMKW